MPRASRPLPQLIPQDFSPDRFILGGRMRPLDCRPGSPDVPGAHIMGILNVTPDSFSDGGQFTSVEAAVSRAADMLSEGASIIDIGGESTRPGADPLRAEDERDRVVPVIEALSKRFPEARLSIDTYKPEVARAALAAGAHMINDVTGLRLHPEMAKAASDWSAPLVLMHSVGEPGDLTGPREFDDVTAQVRDSLARSVETAKQEGVEHIVVDPGFGFGKSHKDNLRLINEVDELLTLNRPVLVGVSRKSTIGETLSRGEEPVPVDERLYGTLGVTAVAVLRGATLVRTHDVAATADLLEMIGHTLRQS